MGRLRIANTKVDDAKNRDDSLINPRHEMPRLSTLTTLGVEPPSSIMGALQGHFDAYASVLVSKEGDPLDPFRSSR